MITSKDNDYIKHVRLLYQKKFREKFGEYIVEGIKMVLEAIQFVDVSKIILSPESLSEYQVAEVENLLMEHGYSLDKILYTTSKVFEYISDTETPQGAIAIVKYDTISLDEYIKTINKSFFILDRVQDPGNLGTIIRTLDSAGFSNLVLSSDTVDPYNMKTIRSTMGSIFRVKVFRYQDELVNFLDRVKACGFKVVATSLKTNDSIYDLNFSKEKYAIIMGNESQGVSENILNNSDVLVKIPMLGNTESLNVAVATSIIAFEKVRQEITKD